MAVQVVSKSELAKGMICVHRMGKMSASSAGESAAGLFCASSPESITLTGSQGLFTWQATMVSPLFSPHTRTPQRPAHPSRFCVRISWAKQDKEAAWVSFRPLCYARGTANVHPNELRVQCEVLDLMGPGMCVAAAQLTSRMGKGSFLVQQGSHRSAAHFTYTSTLGVIS